jgi:hypothetical protein
VFKKLFGKKNDGFYLQLEDDKDTPKPAAKAKSAPPASVAPAPVVTAPATASVAPVATTQAAPAPVAVAAPTETAAKKSVKKSVKKTETDKKVEEIKLPVSAAVAAPAITSFASDYLIKPSSDSSRRRPGANMNAFLDMARQAKKPEPFKK